MLGNRHITVAMIVAPILALISYFATDFLVSEAPKMAEDGQQYELLARSNCRYESGRCTLRNGDDELTLRINADAFIELESNMPVEGVQLAFVSKGTQRVVSAMRSQEANGQEWLSASPMISMDDTLRLALKLDNKVFYATAPTTFVNYRPGIDIGMR